MPKQTKSAFDLTDRQFKGRWASWETFGAWLATELDQAVGMRGTAADEVRYCWDYYEQNRMRGRNAPWPDAADLPSPLAAEYVDAVHARLMQTIFVDPVWTVEGYGESAKRAPFVEEFHQRAQEDERLQSYIDEWVLRGLVEGVGTLEITEAYDLQRQVKRRRVKVTTDETTGQPVMGEDAKPMLAKDPETEDFIDAEGEDDASAEVDVDQWEPVRMGPEYDVVPFLDFYTLPGHARNDKQVWGYAKRFFRRVPQLEASAARGVYDADQVEAIGTADESSAATAQTAPETTTAVPQDGATAQKELFECQLLMDLDGEGERWWRITFHKETRRILRGKRDDRTTRYIRWRPFPKPGTVDRGYSLIGNKLITVIEEDTARRNMTADRMALVAGQPVKRRQGALWDPFEQPFGPRSVIDVRDMDEVQPMQGIQDVPQSVMAWRGQIRDDADRLVGQNDVALGVGTADASKPTATQVTTTAGYAEVRMSVVVQRMREPMEELGQARHTIWIRCLQANPTMPVQRAMVIGRTIPGIDVSSYPEDNKVTGQLLEGTFWLKPKGSVESSDLNKQQQWFVGMMQALPPLLQLNPGIAQVLGTIPAAKSFVEQLLRVFRWPDRQSILGSEANNVFDILQQQQEQAQMQQKVMGDPRMQIMQAALGGGAPGAPMGGPPGAPPAGPTGTVQ